MPISKDAVNAVRERLSELQTGHGNITLILERLSSLETASNDQVALQKAWDEVSPDLAKLVHDDKVLDGKIYDSLAQEIASHGITLTPQENLEEFKRVAQQLLEQINAMDNDISDILMPAAKGELREGVNAAFTLRALSLHPRRALPAGKTLLSLFMKENDDRSEQEKQKEKQINDIVKKAYWDAALEQVSSPSPDIQIPRLKVFYHDLFSALKPFISREHPVMVALSSPLSPSSNHLASALNYLILALNLMKSVCAPIHDNDIDETLAKLENIHKLHVPRETLAEEYISGMKFALHMGQTIADDYQSFMLKYGDESNIAAMLRGSAREQEREVIVGLFGQEKISRLWKRWKGSDSGVWTDKLLDVVGSLEPLMASPDLLPPPLIMSRVDLAEAQTLFLGLIITASIRSLVPQLSPGRLSVLYRDNQDALQKEATFTERLWTLIGADPFTNDHATTESDLDGIVEEVVSLWRMRNPDASGDTLTKETELRDMTRQIINQEAHPVRELLKKRLLDGLKQRIAQPIIPREKASGPNHISAGRALKPVARLKPSKG
ncbi:hypothetical protein FRC18_003056 [Serendipita sp. 400]|nr:hypothetical protein FRC18_003056 [Serendipita sp. 400]